MAATTPRQQYEQRPLVRLKRYIKNTDPEYVKKRKLYANKEDVKNRRKTLNKRRRMLSTTLINLAKTNQLRLGEVDELTVIRGRLCTKKDEILSADKSGVITRHQYNNEFSLDDSKYDNAEKGKHDEAFEKLLGSYMTYLNENSLKIEDKENLDKFLKGLKDGSTGNSGPIGGDREDGECDSESSE